MLEVPVENLKPKVATLASHEDLRRKIEEMDKRYDARFQAIFATIKQMLGTPVPPKRQIGFHARVEPPRRTRQKPSLNVTNRK